MDYCIVLSTTETREEAEKIAGILLENRAASCVQISPIVSIYRWKGKVERAGETRLVIKTTCDLYEKAEKLIKENHSYEVPQIVKVPVTGGLPEYLGWISQETGK
jgi:periplasmic divalent cation tolerance protein